MPETKYLAGEEMPPILVVDDDKTMRVMFRQMLELDGHRVVEAQNGAEAVELFDKHKPLLALVDAVMPVMDGFELCQRLHSMEGSQDLTVLMATSLSEDDDIQRAFKAGAADFIAKPINWTVLKERVKHLLQGKLAERMMRETEEQLRLSMKMSAIGSLSSGIAHEFNNILASVMGYTELLMEHLEKVGEGKPVQYAHEIYNSSVRARDLVQQMQLFSQSKPGHPQRLNPNILVKENLKIIRSSLPASIELIDRIEGDLPAIETDPALFQQLLTNLLLNARDAVTDKGTISVSVTQAKMCDCRCSSCHQAYAGNYVKISVEDNGGGIGADKLNNVFEPYYTSKPVGRGTGMGLSVVHGIMHDIGGHIDLESSYGDGTTITLMFPLDNAVKREDVEVHEVKTRSGKESQKHILLVDDETSITGYLRELLEMHDYEVTVKNDSQDALSLFLGDPDAFDIVITDMTLPGISGIELASSMLQLRPELPVVLCSGYIDDETRNSISACGIRESFNKPVDSKRLLHSVEEILQA